MKRILTIIFLIFTSSFILGQTFSVQGVLRNPNGTTVSDGNYSVVFKLYSVATGGTNIWTETHSSVSTKHGVFSAELGNPVSGTATAFSGIGFDVDYWVGVSVNGGTEMTPRFKLTKSPYAIAALGSENKFPSAGNVGVGTLSPAEKLHVSGNIKGNKFVDDDATYYADLNAGANLGGDWKFNGNIGIGVTPTQKLDVNGSVKASSIIFPDGSSFSSAQMGGSASSVNANSGDAIVNGGTVKLQTGSTDRLVVTSDGKVGIGTTAPAQLLELYKNDVDVAIRFHNPGTTHWTLGSDYSDGGKFKLNYGASVGENNHFTMTTGGNVGIGTASPTGILDVLYNKAINLRPGNSSYTGGLRWDTNGGETMIFGAKATGGKMMFAIGHDILTNQGSPNQLPSNPEMTIMNGKVGIGTTSPQAPLQVTSSGSTSPWMNGLSLRNSTNGATQHATFDIRTWAGAGDPMINWSINNERNYSMGIDNSDGNKLKISRGSGNLTDHTYMTITESGNVGIGTASPTGILDVSYNKAINLRPGGSTYTGGLRWDTNGGETMIFGAKHTGGKMMFAIGHDISTNQGSSNQLPSNPEMTIGDGYVSVEGSLTASSYFSSPGLNATGGPNGTTHFNYSSNGHNYIRGITHIDHDLYLPWRLFYTGGFEQNIYNSSGSDDEWQLKHDGSYLLVAKHTNGWNRAHYDGDSNWDFYSDRRLKRDIQNEKNILNRVMKLDVVNYIFKNNTYNNTEIGFIAQDVEPYFPSLVSETYDEQLGYDVKSLGYSTFGVVAIGAIKELKEEKDAEIAELHKTIASLTQRLEALENK